MRRSPRTSHAFTLLETLLIAAVIAVIVMLAFPRLSAIQSKSEARSAVTAVAGVMRGAREDAISDGKPRIVRIEPGSGGGPDCPVGYTPPEIKLIVDEDSSYGASLGDDITTHTIEAIEDCSIVPISAPGVLSSLLPQLTVPDGDTGLASTACAGGMLAACSGQTLTAVTNYGTTLPINAGGVEFAYSPKGSAVDPSTPNQFGSGAGGIYLTDGETLVYVVTVATLGRVNVRAFDLETLSWK